MTRERLRNMVRKRLGETTSSFWTDTELNNWLDDSGHDIAEKTKCIKDSGNITTIEDQMEYTLSSNFPTYLSVYEVYFYQDGDKWRRIDQTDRRRLSRDYTGWKSADAATPMMYYWDKEEDVIGFYPKPDEDNAGSAYVEVYYTKDYTNMTGDSGSPTGIPTDLQLAMVDFVVAIGYETRGWGDKANDAWKKYYARLQQYMVDRDTEKQEDDVAIQMVNYRNVH